MVTRRWNQADITIAASMKPITAAILTYWRTLDGGAGVHRGVEVGSTWGLVGPGLSSGNAVGIGVANASNASNASNETIDNAVIREFPGIPHVVQRAADSVAAVVPAVAV